MFASNTSNLQEEANYIESVFSTYLYTGNGSTQTITNGIDLAGKGGLTWIKSRSAATRPCLFDTARGAYQMISSAFTFASVNTSPYDLSSFNNNGFTLQQSGYGTNAAGETYASWTFRKQPKFFDIVRYTGTGSGPRQISHNLGSVPGCIIIKSTTSAEWWSVYHRSTGVNNILYLNDTSGVAGTSNFISAVDATTFTLNSSGSNSSGDVYIAYVFAHNAGGFGLTGTDNVITCGSFTTDGSGNFSVNLGYEPQFVMYKGVAGGAWIMLDTMRGMSLSSGGDAYLQAQSAAAEATSSLISPTATGFQNDPTGFGASLTYVYIAIRRGPMKTPTTGTSVFLPSTPSTDYSPITTGFPVDMFFDALRAGQASNTIVGDRLRGQNPVLRTSQTSAEVTGFYGGSDGFQSNTTFTPYIWGSGAVVYMFQRAPGFFDEVCYTGNGVNNTARNHNLGVVPELIIFKDRTTASNWIVYCQYLNGSTSQNNWNLRLNTTAAQNNNAQMFGNQIPTATYFYTGGNAQDINFSGDNYVAWLFATCPGVSKVGTYSGTGATQTINCGFTGGARFVLIKRIDTTGDWYVWDTARGMVAGTDPSLLLNSTAAEVNANSVYTTGVGFQIVSTAAGINASGGSYIFLAVA